MTAIHAFPVARGILAIAPLPGSDGDYAGDLEHITAWAPAIVLSLSTVSEMTASGAQDLGAHLQDRGTRWVHLPISDFGLPDDDASRLWAGISAGILRALSGGGRVLVHCRGGCGRSGMVALRLMIEAGEAQDEALLRLRRIRPCAIETKDQMDWALKGARTPAIFHRHSR